MSAVCSESVWLPLCSQPTQSLLKIAVGAPELTPVYLGLWVNFWMGWAEGGRVTWEICASLSMRETGADGLWPMKTRKLAIALKKTQREVKEEGDAGCRWHVWTLMAVICGRTLRSVYIITDRLSSGIDWSGFNILFFPPPLFPSNRHPLVKSYVCWWTNNIHSYCCRLSRLLSEEPFEEDSAF